jgi:hypothetical protein
MVKWQTIRYIVLSKVDYYFGSKPVFNVLLLKVLILPYFSSSQLITKLFDHGDIIREK